MDEWIVEDEPQESRDWEVCDHGLYFEDFCEDCEEEAAEEAE